HRGPKDRAVAGLYGLAGSHDCAWRQRLKHRPSLLPVSRDQFLLLDDHTDYLACPMSNDLILSSAIVNVKSSSTGLPGKLPVSRARSFTVLSLTEASIGSISNLYLASASRFHALIASMPR